MSYQTVWAANMIVATADRALIESLAARNDVARINSPLVETLSGNAAYTAIVRGGNNTTGIAVVEVYALQ